MGETVTVNGVVVAVDDAAADGNVQIVKLATATDASATVIAPATEGKQDAGNALLTTIDGDTGTLAALSQARSAAVSAGQTGLMAYGVRDDALSAAAEAEGEASPLRIDANGAAFVQLAGALSSVVDSILLGLPSGAVAARKYLRVTTASTGVDLWDPTLDYAVVKWFVITWSGANACRLTIWQGANADTTFTDGTDPVLFDMNLDANANGGVAFAYPESSPWKTGTVDHELHVTTSADKIVSITVGGFETD